jgi:hypothetical protein
LILRHRLYLLLPDWLDRAIQQSVARIKKLRAGGTVVERIHGKSVSGEPIKVLVTGRTTTVDYLLRRLLIGHMEYTERHTLSGGAVGREVRDCADIDLKIIRCRGKGDRLVQGDWRIPDAVESIIDLDPAARDPEIRYGDADTLRRVRNHKLSATVSHDRRELRDFVRNAYVPHIRERFGDLARPHSELTIARAFKSGGLLWVERHGVRVAGMVFSTSGHTISSRIAAPVSDPELVENLHAVSATKKFLLDYAIEHGYRYLDLGRSRPQLMDGVLRHKKRWGARLLDSPKELAEFHLSWRVLTPAIAQWLRTTPLVIRDSGGLAGLTALAEDESSDDCLDRLRRLWSPGLARIIVLSHDGQNPGIDEIFETPVTWQRANQAAGYAQALIECDSARHE